MKRQAVGSGDHPQTAGVFGEGIQIQRDLHRRKVRSATVGMPFRFAHVQIALGAEPVKPGAQQAFHGHIDAVVLDEIRQQRMVLCDSIERLPYLAGKRPAVPVFLEQVVECTADRVHLLRAERPAQRKKAERRKNSTC